jgi:hypothetical protein
MYVLTRAGKISGKVEQGKQALLQEAHAGQAGGSGELSLSLTAGIDDQGFADAGEFFQFAI